MEKTGITFKPFQLRWYTTSLNRLILKISLWHPEFLSNWFTFGSWITISLVVPSVCLIIVTSARLCTKIFSEPSTNQQNILLEPIVINIFVYNIVEV